MEWLGTRNLGWRMGIKQNLDQGGLWNILCLYCYVTYTSITSHTHVITLVWANYDVIDKYRLIIIIQPCFIKYSLVGILAIGSDLKHTAKFLKKHTHTHLYKITKKTSNFPPAIVTTSSLYLLAKKSTP